MFASILCQVTEYDPAVLSPGLSSQSEWLAGVEREDALARYSPSG
jgi:hypothetical protein